MSHSGQETVMFVVVGAIFLAVWVPARVPKVTNGEEQVGGCRTL